MDRLLYFDADLWFVAAWNPTGLPSLSAVRDNELYEGMRRECDRFGLVPDQYFNSGLLIIDRQHTGMLRTAPQPCGICPQHPPKLEMCAAQETPCWQR